MCLYISTMHMRFFVKAAKQVNNIEVYFQKAFKQTWMED